MTAGDSLHNINTMISAYEIAKRGVPMYALRQMPGEFVVTFPRAYHGGFSLGFNIGEAVNFATPDWVQHARLANEHYRTIARLGVVGHDRLMFTLAHNVDTYTDIASCEALRGEVWRIAEEEARTISDGVTVGGRACSPMHLMGVAVPADEPMQHRHSG